MLRPGGKYWFFELVPPPPAKIAAAPGAPVTAATDCSTHPCFVCELRAMTMEGLQRMNRLDPRYLDQARAKQTAASAGGASPRDSSAHALELVIIGLRRKGSVSDAFDDYLVTAFLLPSGGDLEKAKKAVEAKLLAALEADVKAVQECKSSKVKPCLVDCSRGTWVVQMYKATTDPGFQMTRAGVDAVKKKLQKQVETATADLNKARKEKSDLEGRMKSSLTELDKVLAKADNDLSTAVNNRKAAVEQVKEAKDEAAAAAATEKLRAASADERLALRSKGEAAAAKGKLLAKLDAADQKIQAAQSAVTTKEAELNGADAAASREKAHVRDGDEGWVEQKRAMMMPGHFSGLYRYFIHKIGDTEAFAKPTSLVALVTNDSPEGGRLVSKLFLRENPKLYGKRKVKVGKKGKEVEVDVDGEYGVKPLVLERRPASGDTQYFYKDETRLVETEGAAPDLVLRDVKSNKETKLADEDVLLIVDHVDGTNIHRGHNANPDNGVMKGSVQSTVGEFSHGCQTMPVCEDFNLFIRLCAVSKRWLCVCREEERSKTAKKSAPEVTKRCSFAVPPNSLEELKDHPLCQNRRFGSAATGREPPAFSVEWVLQAGDDAARQAYKPVKSRSEAAGKVQKKIDKLKELTAPLTEKQVARLNALRARSSDSKKKPLNNLEETELETLENRANGVRTEEDAAEIKELEADQAAWRLEYVQTKVERLATDYMRDCDLRCECDVSFSYTLVELEATEIKRLEDLFKAPNNKPWNGVLG